MLLHALTGDFKFAWRCFVGLLCERMENDDVAIDDGAVENTRNAFGRFQPQFKQPVAHCSRVRHAEIGAVNFHAFGVTHEPREKAIRHRENLGFDAIAMKGDCPLHLLIIANTLFSCALKLGLCLLRGFRLAGTVERNRFKHKRLEGSPINFSTFEDVNRAPHISIEA